MRNLVRGINRARYWLVAVGAVSLLAGCAQLKYYMQAAQGQYALWSDARPIDEMAWLPAAYVMTNVCMNLLLVKFRQQFGLRAFTEVFLVLYALVTFGTNPTYFSTSLWMMSTCSWLALLST